MRYRVADLVQQSGPFDPLRRFGDRRRDRTLVQRLRHRRDANRMRAVDPIAFDEPFDRRLPHVASHPAAEQIVEHAQAHRAANGIDTRHLE